MTFEKINKNKFKCTLYKTDLEKYDIKLSELAYGNQKARKLFDKLIRVAEEKYGFEAGETPIMIEALPESHGTLVLIITRVENPEELDPKFSHFTHRPEDIDEDIDETENSGMYDFSQSVLQEKDETETDPDNAETDEIESEESEDLENDEVKNSESEESDTEPVKDDIDFNDIEKFLSKIKDQKGNPDISNAQAKMHKKFELPDFEVLQFMHIQDIISFAHETDKTLSNCSRLFQDQKDGRYFLQIYSSPDEKSFRKIIRKASEYGIPQMGFYMNDYLEEHFRLVIDKDALQKFAKI